MDSFDKVLIGILIFLVLLLIGAFLLEAKLMDDIKKGLENKCESENMKLLSWEWAKDSSNGVIITCFEEGINEIKLFKIEGK